MSVVTISDEDPAKKATTDTKTEVTPETKGNIGNQSQKRRLQQP